MRELPYVLISVGLISSGCVPAANGGQIGLESDAGVPLSVLDTSPADIEDDVSLDGVVSALFSAELDESTVTEMSFTLSRHIGSVEGSVGVDSADPSTALLAPDEPLALRTNYTATLTTALRDLDGNALQDQHRWSFRTRDGVWTAAGSADSGAADGSAPQVAADPNGDAVAVWAQADDIWSNRYSQNGGWANAGIVDADTAGVAASPQVAVDPSGNAVAIWVQDDGARSDVWSSRYTPGGGWGAAQNIDTTGMDASESPQLAVDSGGNAIAVWVRDDGVRKAVWSNRYTAGGTWGTAERIEENTGDAINPEVAVDPDGNAVAVWDQDDGLRRGIWSNRYATGAQWGTAERVEENTGDAFNPDVAVDLDGNATAVWDQDDGTRFRIWSSRYVPGDGWGAAEIIDDNMGNGSSARVAVDGSGIAIAVWRSFEGARGRILANHYTPGTEGGWGPVEFFDDNGGSALAPQVAVDPTGNAVAIWYQSDAMVLNIWSIRYTPRGKWEVAQNIEDDAADASFPQVAVDPSGRATAVWQQADGAIGSNRFE